MIIHTLIKPAICIVFGLPIVYCLGNNLSNTPHEAQVEIQSAGVLSNDDTLSKSNHSLIDKSNSVAIAAVSSEKILDHAAEYKLLTNKSQALTPSESRTLGYIYLHGYGAKQDYTKARNLLELAVDGGDLEAHSLLGFIHERGFEVPIDYSKALRLYHAAAKEGNPLAINNLGHLYENGLGVKLDRNMAADLYKRASERGNALAMNNLGCAYLTGSGVQIQQEKGLELLIASANKKELRAMRNLEVLYEDGLLVHQNKPLANKWREKADALEEYYHSIITQ